MNLAELFNLQGVFVNPNRLPKHLAFSFETTDPEKDFEHVRTIAMLGFKCKIPVLSFSLMGSRVEDSDRFTLMVDAVERFFSRLARWDYLIKHQVKVTVLGHWYDLPGRVVDAIKKVLEETKEFDQFFLTMCVNYDGQEEIVDACKLVTRQALAGKIVLDNITKEVVKENLASSYFIPPGIIVRCGTQESGSLLLWDSPSAVRHFTGKPWQEFDKTAFFRALERYQNEAYR